MNRIRSLRLQPIAPLLAGVAVAAAVGTLLKPPSEDSATVTVAPKNATRHQIDALPSYRQPALAGVTISPDAQVGGGAAFIQATAGTEVRALDAARAAAKTYVRELMSREDRRRRRARGHARAPVRFALLYDSPTAGAGGASAPLRAALLGLLASALATMLVRGGLPRLAVARSPGARASTDSGRGGTGTVLAASVLAAAAAVALSSASPAGVYTLLWIGLAFAIPLLHACRAGPRGIRTVIIVVIALSPLRGAALALADTIDLPNALLTFEAIAPALIAGCALAAIAVHRSAFWPQPTLLVASWLGIAAVAGLDVLTQSAGLKLYGIGLTQYLAYPTLAALAWPILEDRDGERLILAFAALGLAVGLSIFLEDAGVPFVEAAVSRAPGGVGIRYGGATGSYLHAAIFLGTTIVLALSAGIARWSRPAIVATVGVVAAMLAGLSLTYSRGGLGVAFIGALALLAALRGRDRLRLVAVAVAATGLSLLLSSALGPSPTQIASHASAAASIKTDEGNSLRFDTMRQTIDLYRGLPAGQKMLGQGLASTGNAGKLVSRAPAATESYPLKLLVEAGIVGLLVIGGLFVWAVLRFALTARAARDPIVAGIGAAGIGLSAEAIIYPTLEVQLIALTWWLLLALSLKAAAR